MFKAASPDPHFIFCTETLNDLFLILNIFLYRLDSQNIDQTAFQTNQSIHDYVNTWAYFITRLNMFKAASTESHLSYRIYSFVFIDKNLKSTSIT